MEQPGKNKDIHILYKKLGETPLECLLRYKKDNPVYRGVAMSYAGRLDPMAEGVLLIISGENLNTKDDFLSLPKTYEFEVLWEFKTDTDDILGSLSPDEVSIFPTVDHIQKYVATSVGKFEQSYPQFSSQPVNGKPLIQWAREGKINEIEIPKHEVEIFEAEYLSRNFIKGKDLMDVILQRICLVTGDFRQNEIIEKWKKALNGKEDKEFALDKIKMSVSGGFYVRQFVSDLSKEMGVQATTYHILRTKVGDFTL